MDAWKYEIYFLCWTEYISHTYFDILLWYLYFDILLWYFYTRILWYSVNIPFPSEKNFILPHTMHYSLYNHEYYKLQLALTISRIEDKKKQQIHLNKFLRISQRSQTATNFYENMTRFRPVWTRLERER